MILIIMYLNTYDMFVFMLRILYRYQTYLIIQLYSNDSLNQSLVKLHGMM